MRLAILSLLFAAAAPCLAQTAGNYLVTPASDNSLCMDVQGYSTLAGGVVEKYQCLPVQWNQQWTFTEVSGGYRITARHDGQCLDVSGASRSVGGVVIQWPCNGGSNEVWMPSQVGSAFQLVSRNSGLCLSLPSTGSQLVQVSCSTSASSQLWNLTPVGNVALNVTSTEPDTVPGIMPGRASDFVDSVGVVTHFGYTDTPYYQQPDKTIALIQAAGIRHVRDGLMWGWIAPNLPAIHTKLAAAGIGADLITPNPDAGITSAALAAAVATHKDAEAIEGPNEWDQAGGKTWVSTLRAYLPIVQAAGKAAKLPVYGPSLTSDAAYTALGNVGQYMDLNSEHNYWGGRNPETTGWGGANSSIPPHYYGSMDYDFDDSAIIAPDVPIVQTESGYVADNAVSQNIISEATAAVYEPRLLLHSWNKGVKRTYLYELMDEPSSTTGYGLLRSDMSERPGFTAVASLMNLLADEPNTAALAPLPYTLTGTGLETTLLQKKDGSYWLAVYNPACIWDINALKPMAVATQAVTLTLAGAHTVVGAYQLDSTGAAVPLAISGASVTVDVSSAVTLIKML